jgi:hypothetical protein
VYDLCVGSRRKEVIHRAALVGFQMGKSDPTQFLERDHGSHGSRYVGKHMAKARMKEKRFLAVDQKLIECKTWTHGRKRRNSINFIGDLIDSCFHERSLNAPARRIVRDHIKRLPGPSGAALR